MVQPRYLVSKALPVELKKDEVQLLGTLDCLRSSIPRNAAFTIEMRGQDMEVLREGKDFELGPLTIETMEDHPVEVITVTLADGSKVKFADFTQTQFVLNQGEGFSCFDSPKALIKGILQVIQSEGDANPQ